MNSIIKEFVKSHSAPLSRLYYIFMNNKVSGAKGNVICRNNAFIRGLRVVIHGVNNRIIIGGDNPSLLSNCRIEVHGSNNQVVIGGGCSARNLTIYCANHNCLVHVKDDSQISGKTELAVMEGTKIVLGKGCLFSANITFRAGDSHSIIDATTGERINQSRDIIVGDHVWVGNTVIVTKGTVIGDNSVIATGAVVTGKSYPNNSIIGGNPAKVIKDNINWDVHKI